MIAVTTLGMPTQFFPLPQNACKFGGEGDNNVVQPIVQIREAGDMSNGMIR